MKIGMLVNNLEVSGGYQKLVIRLAQQLQLMGHEVITYTPKLNTQKCYPHDIKELTIKALGAKEGDVSPVAAYRKLLPNIVHDLDALIIHDELSLIGVALLPYRPKKIVWMLNNQLPSKLTQYIPEIKSVYSQTVGPLSIKLEEAKKAYERIHLIRQGIERIDKFATYDTFNKQLVETQLRRRATNVYAGADLESFSAHAKNRQYSKKSLYSFLSVGVLFPHRRYEDVIRAMAELTKMQVDATLTIVGRQDLSPDYFNELQQLTSSLNLSKRVTFKHYVDDKEMVRLYTDSDAFIFVNDGFTWGISVFEAVAAGMPVVITSNIGAADLIHSNHTGWVVEPRQPAQIAAALKDIATKRSTVKAYTQTAQQELMPLLTWQAYAKRMTSLIE